MFPVNVVKNDAGMALQGVRQTLGPTRRRRQGGGKPFLNESVVQKGCLRFGCRKQQYLRKSLDQNHRRPVIFVRRGPGGHPHFNTLWSDRLRPVGKTQGKHLLRGDAMLRPHQVTPALQGHFNSLVEGCFHEHVTETFISQKHLLRCRNTVNQGLLGRRLNGHGQHMNRDTPFPKSGQAVQETIGAVETIGAEHDPALFSRGKILTRGLERFADVGRCPHGGPPGGDQVFPNGLEVRDRINQSGFMMK